ncbi:MAG: sirohydrochlorin chelatase [Microcoleaceae cyanobacterium]
MSQYFATVIWSIILSTAYFLVAHGSRDPRPQLALEQIAEQLRLRLSTVHFTLIGTGVLECAPLSLTQQLQQFADLIRPQGMTRIKILPLFLLPGVHVKEDIPVEVAMAQQILGSEMTLEVLPYMGSQVDKIATVLADQMKLFTVETWIVMAHGSSRQGGNQPIKFLADKLAIIPAYWSVSPNLSEQIQALIQQGYSKIGVLPYFLFTGGITDAIAQSIQNLSQQFIDTELYLAKPLDQTTALIDLAQVLLFNEMEGKE